MSVVTIVALFTYLVVAVTVFLGCLIRFTEPCDRAVLIHLGEDGVAKSEVLARFRKSTVTGENHILLEIVDDPDTMN